MMAPEVWTANAVLALRQALRMSRQDFAKHLGVSTASVRNWDNGGGILGSSQRLLDAAWQRLTADEKARFAARVRPTGGTDVAIGWQRKAAGVGQQTAALDGFDASVLDSIELVRMLEVTNVGEETLDLLRHSVHQIGRDYLTSPHEVVFREVQRLRCYTLSLLEDRQPSPHRRRLHELAGWLTALLGHVSLDLGHYPAAAVHCSTAMRLAKEAQAQDLMAWVRGTQMMASVFAGAPQQATGYGLLDERFTGNATAINVRAIAQEARAWARIGDKHRAKRTLETARDLFHALPTDPEPGIFSFQAPYLPFYAGTIYIWLDEPEESAINAQAAVELCDADPDQWPVARVSARLDLAIASARRGEIDRACAVGGEALTLAHARPSAPTRQRAVELLNELSPHSGRAEVKDVEERVALLATTTGQEADPGLAEERVDGS
jgi:tetratricopeptide (TPR) repeat protein